jgi:hypothetical protein
MFTYPIRSSALAQVVQRIPSCVALALVTGISAIALSACGGGGGGGNNGGGSSGGSGGVSPPSTPTPTSSISIFAGNPNAVGSQNGAAATAQFNEPTGIAVDPSGNFYVADSQNFTIREISGGNVSTFAGSPASPGTADGTGSAATFAGPQNIVMSAAGNLYVTDLGAEAVTVREITPTAQVTTLVNPLTSQALQTNGSTVLATDSASNLYLFTTQSATGASVLTQVTPAGAVNVIALTSTTGAPLGLINPQGVAVDSANNVYIADDNVEDGAGVLYKVAINGATGQATVLAGSTATAGSQDGAGSAATFDGLSNLTLDPSGNVYANDYNNGTIREISPAGVVSTLAGTPGQTNLALGPLPGTLPDIDQIVWYNQSLYATDIDDNVILQLSPAP